MDSKNKCFRFDWLGEEKGYTLYTLNEDKTVLTVTRYNESGKKEEAGTNYKKVSADPGEKLTK